MRGRIGMFDRVAGLSARSRFLIALGATVICALATRAHALSPEMPGKVFPQLGLELLTVPPKNETGLTLRDVLDKKLWTVVRHPLRLEMLNQIAGSIHQVPGPGVQLELLTPGAGLTIHFRW